MLLAFVPDPLRWPVGDPHPEGGEASLELSFCAGAPADGAPLGVGQHVFSRYRENVWNVPPPGTSTLGNRPDHRDVGRVHREVARNTNCPGQFAICETVAER